MKYVFKQKEWEKLPLVSIRFKVNYWLLKKVGLVLFGIIAILLGVLVTVIFYEHLIN
jgi:hypothetical protein